MLHQKGSDICFNGNPNFGFNDALGYSTDNSGADTRADGSGDGGGGDGD